MPLPECDGKFMFVAIKVVVFLNLQVQGKVRERITPRETRRIEQEKPDKNWNPSPAETDEFVELLECFQRNSAGSACPNIARGIFVSSEKARDLPKRL